MRKRLALVGIISVGTVAITLASTGAYFSDKEISTANILETGKFDLEIDNTCHYNGQVCSLAPDNTYHWDGQVSNEPCFCTWKQRSLTNELFFNFLDIKPGDTGKSTISLHVDNNDAWICAQILNVKNTENGCNETEALTDDSTASCGDPGENEGELLSHIFFTVWKDANCDNVHDQNEQVIVANQSIEAGQWPIADSNTGGPLKGDTTSCLGVGWNIPATTSNIIQTDSLTGDIQFTAIQSRNIPEYICTPVGGCIPETEVCDGIDNNCNSEIDENCPVPELFFSEYVEGSSNNKAVEIYNPSPTAIDLTQYKVEVYANGAVSPTATVNLLGSVVAGGNYVLCHSLFIDPPKSTICNQTSGSLNFNGNDAVVLRKTTAEAIDIIGLIGFDPGTEWGGGLTSTTDNTLVRKCTIDHGDANGGDVFNPSIEWDGFTQNDFTHLGSHTYPCP